MHAGQLGQIGLSGVGKRRLGELLEEAVRFAVDDAVPLLDGGPSDGLCESGQTRGLTSAGTDLRLCELRRSSSRSRRWGSHYPSLLQPRRRAEPELRADVQRADGRTTPAVAGESRARRSRAFPVVDLNPVAPSEL